MEAVAPFALLLSLWSRSIPGWDPKAAGRRPALEVMYGFT